jgi:homoaconitase/3-isopropylmalate dehydratase large subunit
VVGTDSHTTTHGALGAFAFGIGATEMASVWALGIVLNVEVPATIKVNVKGRFKKHVSAKDLILHLIGRLTAQGANFKVLEFHGETIRRCPRPAARAWQHVSRGGCHRGHRPADEETVRYLREEAWP